MKKSSKNTHLDILDSVRVLATISVFFYHYIQGWFGTSFLIIPEGFIVNFQRLQIFKGDGVFDNLKNLFVYPFVYGFAAVNVFLILSGFVLTWSALKKDACQKKVEQENLQKQGRTEKNIPRKSTWGISLLKKIKRILIPFYWSVIITFILLGLRNFLFPAFSWWPDYQIWDYLKIFFPPFLLFDTSLLQQLSGDYWFIPLILQFYIIFPLLFLLLKKTSAGKFLLIMAVITMGYRFLATYGYSLLLPFLHFPFLDTAPMGVITQTQNSYYGFSFFLPRLFEFGLGMSFATWQNQNGKLLDFLTSSKVFFTSLLLTMAGFSLDFFRFGWLFSDQIIGLGLFCLFLNIAKRLVQLPLLKKIFKEISDDSYEIYLLHHNFLNLLVLPILLTYGLHNEWSFWIFMPGFAMGVLLIGKFGRFLNEKTENILRKSHHPST